MYPLLQVDQLQVSFNQEGKKSIAVNSSSFIIERGKLTAIVGESGSGKSVTALSILKLLPADAGLQGKILFSEDGHTQVDIAKAGDDVIRAIRGNKVSMIFQEPMTSLNPVFTCGYQVMEALMQHKHLSSQAAREKTIALFREVQLPDPTGMFKRYPHQLSGGQKQRVMIAMAMSCHPSLMIADEPTTALDVSVQKNILALIKKLQIENNMSVLLISHDLGLVSEVADEIVVMYKGKIVEHGPAKKILSEPQHNYTKALLACRPAPHSKGKRLPVISDFMGTGITTTQSPPTNPPVEHGNIVLSVRNLEVAFPVQKNLWGKTIKLFKAVDNVSFDVFKSETVGLVGESGCGKTTLGRAILQLVKPTAGKIILDGKDIASFRHKALRDARKKLQIVFQDPFGSLNPRITIGDAILEPMQVHNLHNNDHERRERLMNLLEQVGLEPNQYRRYPHQFSGGQRQRICIARALALDPSFLIFDESVSALDVSVQAQVLNLINELKSTFNFTAIFISHDLSVVHYISDRIMVMKEGKIIEQGNADEIYFHPTEEYTQQLIAAIPGKKIEG